MDLLAKIYDMHSLFKDENTNQSNRLRSIGFKTHVIILCTHISQMCFSTTALEITGSYEPCGGQSHALTGENAGKCGHGRHQHGQQEPDVRHRSAKGLSQLNV